MEQSDSERLIAVETALMHLEHECQQLSQALINQQRQIDSLRGLLERFQSALERETGLSEVRDPSEEKPPHY